MNKLIKNKICLINFIKLFNEIVLLINNILMINLMILFIILIIIFYLINFKTEQFNNNFNEINKELKLKEYILKHRGNVISAKNYYDIHYKYPLIPFDYLKNNNKIYYKKILNSDKKIVRDISSNIWNYLDDLSPEKRIGQYYIKY